MPKEENREEKYRQFCWRLLDATKRTPEASPSKESLAILERIVLDKTGKEQKAVFTVVAILCAFDANLMAVLLTLSAVLAPVVQMANATLDEGEQALKDSKKDDNYGL